MRSLAGKTLFISGASRGIGLAIAVRAARDGANVAIEKAWSFANYFETMAFVNALAFVAHRQDHHPELVVQYSRCIVRLSTHDVGGLSVTDFECAALFDALLA
jgi:4a-hydroxytetrahydrobiopterin dehydratase